MIFSQVTFDLFTQVYFYVFFSLIEWHFLSEVIKTLPFFMTCVLAVVNCGSNCVTLTVPLLEKPDFVSWRRGEQIGRWLLTWRPGQTEQILPLRDRVGLVFSAASAFSHMTEQEEPRSCDSGSGCFSLLPKHQHVALLCPHRPRPRRRALASR